MDTTASVGVQQGLAQQGVSLSLIRQTTQEGQAIAAMLEQSVQNIAASSAPRGGVVNLLA